MAEESNIPSKSPDSSALDYKGEQFGNMDMELIPDWEDTDMPNDPNEDILLDIRDHLDIPFPEEKKEFENGMLFDGENEELNVEMIVTDNIERLPVIHIQPSEEEILPISQDAIAEMEGESIETDEARLENQIEDTSITEVNHSMISIDYCIEANPIESLIPLPADFFGSEERVQEPEIQPKTVNEEEHKFDELYSISDKEEFPIGAERDAAEQECEEKPGIDLNEGSIPTGYSEDTEEIEPDLSWIENALLSDPETAQMVTAKKEKMDVGEEEIIDLPDESDPSDFVNSAIEQVITVDETPELVYLTEAGNSGSGPGLDDSPNLEDEIGIGSIPVNPDEDQQEIDRPGPEQVEGHIEEWIRVGEKPGNDTDITTFPGESDWNMEDEEQLVDFPVSHVNKSDAVRVRKQVPKKTDSLTHFLQKTGNRESRTVPEKKVNGRMSDEKMNDMGISEEELFDLASNALLHSSQDLGSPLDKNKNKEPADTDAGENDILSMAVSALDGQGDTDLFDVLKAAKTYLNDTEPELEETGGIPYESDEWISPSEEPVTEFFDPTLQEFDPDQEILESTEAPGIEDFSMDKIPESFLPEPEKPMNISTPSQNVRDEIPITTISKKSLETMVEHVLRRIISERLGKDLPEMVNTAVSKAVNRLKTRNSPRIK